MIVLEALIASITKTMCDAGKITKVYFDEVEEGFISPSIYVPPAEQTPSGDTLTTFRFENSVYFKVFANSTKEAMRLAEIITLHISKAKNIIPILNVDGTHTGSNLRLKSISYKKAEVGIAQIYVRFQSIHAFTSETAPNAAKIIWNMGIK